MKNTIYIIALVIFFNCKAQSPIISIDSMGVADHPVANAYYKDLNNNLDAFEGTWLYTNGNTSIKIALQKKTQTLNTDFYSKSYYEDLIIGEYQYIENGVEKINTLSQLSNNLGTDHSISGNFIHYDCSYLPVDDCSNGEKRLNLSFFDPLTPHHSDILLHKRIINGQQALKAYISNTTADVRHEDDDSPPIEPVFPWQFENIVFYKQ